MSKGAYLPALNTPILRRKSIAGQSVFVALAVLFLLAFLGALFITIIARNLNHTTRTTQTLNADYFAQAGINYANMMLETSPQGADWRPPLQALLSNAVYQNMNNQQKTAYLATVAPGVAIAAYNPSATNYNLPPVIGNVAGAKDPDAPWLAVGFSRYNVGQGRFLIRLSYVFDPNTGFPASGTPVTPSGLEKYIRIEAIGRYGTVDSNDPTTYVNQPPTRLRAEMVAYKPIGLLEYARNITNKDNRADTVNLGDPSVNTAVAGSPYGNGTTVYATTPYNNQALGLLQTFTTDLVTPNVVDFDPNNLPNVRPYPIITTYGSPTGYAPYSSANNIAFGGGSLRVNGNLRLYGVNVAYLNPSIGDDWEIAGSILFDRYNVTGVAANAQAHAQNLANQQAQLEVYSQTVGGLAQLYVTPGQAIPGLLPSTDPFFSTDSGFVRDGNTGTDSNGYPRNVQRQDPPSLDTTDPSSGLTRYRALTISGVNPVNAGNPGTVYVNNNNDIQSESQSIANGYTLRDEWLDKGGNAANWKADFYAPPGVIIHFGPIPNPTPPSTGTPQPYLMLSNGEPAWGITMTRNDTDASGNPIFWPLPNGNTGTSQTIYIVYAPTANTVNTLESSELPAPADVATDPGYPYFFMNAENAPAATITAPQTFQDPDNDITIFAEGNVRVSGMVSDPSSNSPNLAYQHVTVVTNGIGYIDGSLLKGGPGYGTVNNGVTSLASESSVAVLAESYICVNTTQFLAGPTNFNVSTAPAPNNATSPFTLDFSAGQSLTEPVILDQATDFSTNTTASPYSLYISQFMPAGNTALAQGQIQFTDLNGATEVSLSGANPGLLPAGSTQSYGSSPTPPPVLWSSQTTVALPGGFNGTSAGFPASYLPYQLTFSLPSPQNTSQGWEMEHAGIFPSNARIEAILYAQNNSFFVIPGPWFNTNTNDNIFNVANSASPRSGSDIDPNFARFPMNGQPVDMQVSIFGTVAENLPADIGDQSAWNQKWGWIPIYHGSCYPGNIAGSTVETSPLRDASYSTANPQVGLNFSYDPSDGFDSINTTNNGLQYIRLDPYGRPLPVAPDLPVSTDLLYSGQSPNASVLP